MSKPSVAAVQVKKINSGEIHSADDLLAVEEPLEIRLEFGSLNERIQKTISVTMRTPGNDFELALGFLFTEGIIRHHQDVLQIRYCSELNQTENTENIVRIDLKEDVAVDLKKLERHFYTSSSCGVCGKTSIEAVKTTGCLQPAVGNRELTVDCDLLTSLPEELRRQQNIFEHTGGLHAAALFDENGKIIFIREDVGRHNALDKIIGAALAKNLLPLEQCILMLSGRASFELLQKAAMAGIKIVAAVGAPSSLAVETAKDFDMTLIGFLRDERFNIYSGEERILIAQGEFPITKNE
jgi:FdhD protein